MNPHPPPSVTPRWGWKGLRNRYRPDQRIGRGLVTVAPWVDIVLLIVFASMCTLPFVTQPGIAIDLPIANIGEGHSFGHTLVAVLQTGSEGESREIVFFDDRRFNVMTQREALREALHRAKTRRPDLPLVIEADHRIRHGLIIDIFTLAAEAGIQRVHVASRPF